MADETKVTIQVEKATAAHEPVVVPMSDVKLGLTPLPEAALDELAAFILELIALKKGKGWGEWWDAMPWGKVIPWIVAGVMALANLWQMNRPPVTPVPAPVPPVVKPDDRGPPAVPSVKQFGEK